MTSHSTPLNPPNAQPPCRPPPVLIAFRALQGGSVSALMVAANAVLADSWEPAQRGKAMGLFMIPTREREGGGLGAGARPPQLRAEWRAARIWWRPSAR